MATNNATNMKVEDSIELQKTNTTLNKTVKLGTEISDIVLANQQYMLNATKLQLQQDQIAQVNSWLELQHEQEIKNIQNKTGQLISNQTSAYGYSGVTMTGSALDATFEQAKQGALESIYSEINFAYGQIQSAYQNVLLEIDKKAAKRANTANMISSVGSLLSSYGKTASGATKATDAQSKASAEQRISSSLKVASAGRARAEAATVASVNARRSR